MADLSTEDINQMVAQMPDEEVRRMLLENLEAMAATAAPEATAIGLGAQISGMWEAFVKPVMGAFGALPILFQKQGEAFVFFFDKFGGFAGLLTLFGLMAVVLGLGFGVELLAKRLSGRWMQFDANLDGEDASLSETLTFLGKRFLSEIFGMIVFFIVIRITGRLLLSPDQIAFARPFILHFIWVPRLCAVLVRFVLAPEKPQFRLLQATDATARFLQRHLVGLVILAGLMVFTIGFNARNGVPPGVTRIGFWIDLAVNLYLLWIVWECRDGLCRMLGAGSDLLTPAEARAVQFYPVFAIAVVVITWIAVKIMLGVGQIAPLLRGAHYFTMLLLLVAPFFDAAIRGLVGHLTPPMQGEGQVARDAYHSTKRSFIRIGRVLVLGAVVLMLAQVWDIDLAAMMSDRASIADNIIAFIMTCVTGYVVYEGVSLAVNRRLAKEQTEGEGAEAEAGSEGGGAGGSRLATVLPLLRSTVQIAILVIFGLLAVGALGIDITPLLAGAGILGLAIGFGAQKLVSDVVSGVFFLVDDAFRVGEYVEVEGTRGTVEKISIRSMQLRHHRGPVNTIPYGEIPKLTNYSRDWVIMKLKFTVPFDTDPNQVKKIFKKIGAAMLEDPLYKDDFLEPFKSQGVFDFDDVGMVIRGKFMAKPGKQFTIRKEIYNRVKAAFSENGIDFARREVRVALPEKDEARELSPEEQTALAAAAAAQAQQQQPS